MEDGLVPMSMYCKIADDLSLNPCCDGRWSRTITNIVTAYPDKMS